MFGFIFQGFHLLPERTALENVMLPMAYARTPRGSRKERARQLLEKVGMGERTHFRTSQLSGGEKQRVAIARALANDARFILADEPTGNLDSVTREGVLSLLEQLGSEGRTLIVVTHDPTVAERAQRRIALLDGSVRSDRTGYDDIST